MKRDGAYNVRIIKFAITQLINVYRVIACKAE